MDFLKSLLLYMSLTFAMGVQEAPAPSGPPQVTAVPPQVAAQMTAAPETPEPTAFVITPTPTVRVTPSPTPQPVPTVSPNARYKTLRYGDRGNDVRKMQRRLIELKYMDEGSDDGAYGYQTLNAVRAFQRANGLGVDGAAGRVTLTQLYENPAVLVNPAYATPTPTPTATPQATSAPVEIAPPAGLTSAWVQAEDASVILNGDALVLLSRTDGVISQRKPRVFLRDNEPLISLFDLADASSWRTTTNGGNLCVLRAQGYEVALTAVALQDDVCQAYAATVDNAPVAINDGDVVYNRGEWYVSGSFFVKTMGGESLWDADEHAMVLNIKDKSLSQAVD